MTAAADLGSNGSSASIEHREVELGRLRLHVATCGTGEPVVLLHGFPEFWFTWREQMAALARAGYRAVAPDLRGYNLSDKPRRIRDYAYDKLVQDIRDLVTAMGFSSVRLVGHDWGGTIAYGVASAHPELIDRLVVLCAGHPERFRQVLKPGHEQWKKSSYMGRYMVPIIPELFLRRRSYIASRFRGAARNPDAFPDRVVNEYVTAIRRPRAATSMLNYYRATLCHSVRAEAPIRAKTLILWAEQDDWLSDALLEKLDKWIPDHRVQRIANASHWLMADQPEEVNRRLVEFFDGQNEK